MSCAFQVPVVPSTPPPAYIANVAVPGAPGYVAGIPFSSFNGSVALSPRFKAPSRSQRGVGSIEPQLNDLLYGDVFHAMRRSFGMATSSQPSASLSIPVGLEMGVGSVNLSQPSASLSIPVGFELGNQTTSSSAHYVPPAAASPCPQSPATNNRIHAAPTRSMSPTTVRVVPRNFDSMQNRSPTRQVYSMDRRSLSPARLVNQAAGTPVPGSHQQFLGVHRRVTTDSSATPDVSRYPPTYVQRQGPSRRAYSPPRRAVSGDPATIRTPAMSTSRCRAHSPSGYAVPRNAYVNIGTGKLSLTSGGSVNMPPSSQFVHQAYMELDRHTQPYAAQMQPRQVVSRARTGGSTSVERAQMGGASPIIREARIISSSRSSPLEARKPFIAEAVSRIPPSERENGHFRNAPSCDQSSSRERMSSALGSAGVERPNPFLALLPQETRDVINRITELLGERDVLKTHVVVCFKKAVAGENTNLSDDELDIKALRLFRDFLSEELMVPSEAFGDLELEQVRFDFTGTGTLSINEAYRLVKFHLRQYRKHLGGAPVTVDIPFRSLQLAGFTITKELGAGSQGTAKLATNQLGAQFCIKCYRKDKMNAGGVEELKEEFEALQLLHCNSIAGAFEMFQDAHSFYMVGDVFYGGDLLTLKQRAKAQNAVMNEKWWRGIFKQCFEALAFMHTQAMIHCDIKEPNIMVKTEDFHQPQIVIIDLGVAKAMAASDEGIPHGTPGYVPPETWETKKWFPTGDVFSLGVVIVQLITDKSPPSGPRNKDTPGGIFVEGCASVREIFLATQTRPPPMHLMPRDMPDLSDLCERCLEKKMEDRPRSIEALKLPFFSTSSRRKKSSIALDLNARNRFATVGITKEFLAKFASDAISEDEEEDDEDDENTKQKKEELKETLHQIQEAARRSGQSFELNIGHEDDPPGETTSTTPAFEVHEQQNDSFQVTKKSKPVSFDPALELARLSVSSTLYGAPISGGLFVDMPAATPPLAPNGFSSVPVENNGSIFSASHVQPSGRCPISPPHTKRVN